MNKLSTQKRVEILQCLIEGNTIRSAVRLTGASKNTVAKLLVEVGEACAAYYNQTLVGLPCKRIKVDAIWTYSYSKQRTTPEAMLGERGIWTWTATCVDSKLIASWYVGGRDAGTGFDFMHELTSRLSKNIQLISDDQTIYLKAIEDTFGSDIDDGHLIKLYGEIPECYCRYSPCQCIDLNRHAIRGQVAENDSSTAQSLTMRMGDMCRFTQLTGSLSKKMENYICAIALHFMHYNFCRVHPSLNTTPAVSVGVAIKMWTLEEVVEMMDVYWDGKKLLTSN